MSAATPVALALTNPKIKLGWIDMTRFYLKVAIENERGRKVLF